jgi:hypothetical protein
MPAPVPPTTLRAADLAGTEAIAARLLARVMRVASGPPPEPGARAHPGRGEDPAAASPQPAVPVLRHPPWRPQPHDAPATIYSAAAPADESAAGSEPGAAPSPEAYRGRFSVVPLPSEYAGTNTLPGLARDLAMFCTEPGTIAFDSGGAADGGEAAQGDSAGERCGAAAAASGEGEDPGPSDAVRRDADGPAAGTLGSPVAARRDVQRVAVPFVEGAFVLTDALSRAECGRIIACAEVRRGAVGSGAGWQAGCRARRFERGFWFTRRVPVGPARAWRGWGQGPSHKRGAAE